MKYSTILLVVAGLLLAGAVSPLPAAEGFRIVVNRSNPVDSLSREQLSDLFLKKAAHWDSGARAFPVDQDEGAPVRESFSREVHSRSVNAINWYWRRNMFSGSGRVPPTALETDKRVLEYVAANPNAIGYVSSGVNLEGYPVKVLKLNEPGRASR